ANAPQPGSCGHSAERTPTPSIRLVLSDISARARRRDRLLLVLRERAPNRQGEEFETVEVRDQVLEGERIDLVGPVETLQPRYLGRDAVPPVARLQELEAELAVGDVVARDAERREGR